jgi:hypothetical protein
MAIGANHPVFFRVSPTSGAEGHIFNGLQESFFLQGMLVFILKRAGWTQDEIDDNTRKEK